MDKEMFLRSIKLLCEHHAQEATNWGAMGAYSAAHEHAVYAQSYKSIISDIEKGIFDSTPTTE